MEQGTKTQASEASKHHTYPKCRRSKVEFHSHSGILKRFEHLQTFPVIPRPIIAVARGDGDGELARCIRILQRILPSWGEMGVFELLSEVQSYLVCLQLQVGVLRSLVDARCC